MDSFLYVQEEHDNVERALRESLRYDYGPGQTVEYYEECRFRLEGIGGDLQRLRESQGVEPALRTVSNSVTIPGLIGQLWDLANRLTLIERSHLGEFSWPFADAIREIASRLLVEEEGLEGKIPPIIHMIAEGTSYQISSEQVLGVNKKRRLYTVAFPRQLKHHVLMHALFGHELGHATFYSNRQVAHLFADDPPSRKIMSILRSGGRLRDVATAEQWLRRDDAPETVKSKLAKPTGKLTEDHIKHWMVELVCDLFGLAIFGPAFAAAHRTYLEHSCKTEYEIEIGKASHPAYAIRRKVLVGALRVRGWLDPVTGPEDGPPHGAELRLINYVGEDRFPDWATVFTDEQIGEALNLIANHFESNGISVARRPDGKALSDLVGRISFHLPPIRERIDEGGVSTTEQVLLEEQLYAGWTYWLGRDLVDDKPLDFFQLNQLCDLGLLQQQAVDISSGRRGL